MTNGFSATRPRIIVDADSCPVMVRNYLLSYTQKLNVELIFAANKEISIAESGSAGCTPPPNFKMVVCPAADQAADNWILQNVAEYDIVVTRDIPLAAELLKKNIRAMNDRGTFFTNDNIARKLKERDLNMQMSELGLGTKKRYSYGKKEFAAFTKCFDAEIHKLI